MCITTYQQDTKSNPNPNPNPDPNPTSKQHAVVNIQLNIVKRLRIQINSYETCCCTVYATLGCNCHNAARVRLRSHAASSRSWLLLLLFVPCTLVCWHREPRVLTRGIILQLIKTNTKCVAWRRKTTGTVVSFICGRGRDSLMGMEWRGNQRGLRIGEGTGWEERRARQKKRKERKRSRRTG